MPRCDHKFIDSTVCLKCGFRPPPAGEFRVWRAGDVVELACEGTRSRATVVLASSNGRSLMLRFEGVVAGFVGMMPVRWDDDAQFFLEIAEGRRVDVRASEDSDG